MAIVRTIARETMLASRRRGRSRITSCCGGSDAMAMAASVSMMMLTHRICVTVSGISVSMTDPARKTTIAAKLIVSWKRMNRWMLR